jgi:hypothetical protein
MAVPLSARGFGRLAFSVGTTFNVDTFAGGSDQIVTDAT